MRKAMEISLQSGMATLEVIREDIIRCVYHKGEMKKENSFIIEKKEYPETAFTYSRQGDLVTLATWKNFKIQIVEGLNFALSGMPYWTLDIGAFRLSLLELIFPKYRGRNSIVSFKSSGKMFYGRISQSQGDFGNAQRAIP